MIGPGESSCKRFLMAALAQIFLMSDIMVKATFGNFSNADTFFPPGAWHSHQFYQDQNVRQKNIHLISMENQMASFAAMRTVAVPHHVSAERCHLQLCLLP